uniref:AmmeMemoRadiSam system protein A n=1 Tax=Fundidesulfovibrio putealis TaxID=270496 RepID=A0A7C4EMA5_9BACT
MDAFSVDLTQDDKDQLKRIVREAIAAGLDGDMGWLPPERAAPRLRHNFGAFVTLNLDGMLRGCIGHLTADAPLWRTIAEMARAAAFQDPRFEPVDRSEAVRLEVEISVLGPITPCPDPELVEIGRHGLLVARGGKQGLLLPQVPVEWGWNRRTFLEQTCRKAGIAPDAWTKPDTRLFWFEAAVF